jgi:hypothetical protein
MPKIRYLTIQFGQELFHREMPCFRAAVIEKTRRESDLFHNHKDDGAYHYRYPAIQYKVIGRRAALVCLNQGTDDIHYLLQHRSLDLDIGGQKRCFTIEDVHLAYHNVQAWQHRFDYSLQYWQALNQDNYRRYQALESEAERLLMLENLLRANILSFASGIDWQVQEPVEVAITRMKGETWLPFKGQKALCFSLNFRTNVSLPDYIGLGKGVSVGFGSVRGFGEGGDGKMKRRSAKDSPSRPAYEKND